jgi:signal transduction histidine kinase
MQGRRDRRREYNIIRLLGFVEQVSPVNFSTLVRFSRLVSDSSTPDHIFSLLAETVVVRCAARHALVFGTTEAGEFTILSSYGECDASQLQLIELDGVCSIGELRAAVMKACEPAGVASRAFPLISDAGLFGALVALYPAAQPPDESTWTFIEALTELTAISFSKAYQHKKLQKAFDDLRLSQDALVRAEKFRALGQMSAGIAHDLKNLLNPLLLYTDLIRDAGGDRDQVLEIAEKVDRILLRGVQTVERLRDFSRQSSDELEAVPADLNAVAHEAVEICKPRLNGIQLNMQLGSPAKTRIRDADCVTAIVNLIFNAVDSLEGKGTITVSTGSSEGGSWIEVADNGPGIPAEIKTRILEPFFTTKGDLGTGLGLAIVYAFTQRYGGRLEVESEADRGARFRIWIPSLV